MTPRNTNQLWLLVAGFAMCAVGCSSELPADVTNTEVRRSMPIEVQTTAMDQEEAGDRAAAIKTYSAEIEENPHAVDAYFSRAQIYHSNGDYAQAEADFNTVLRHKPRRADAYFCRGRSLQAQGKHHQALVSYSLAIAVEPRQAKWYYLRAKAYEALADEAEADNEPARARELQQRAEQNLTAARQLDPITDFAALDDSGV